MQLKKIFDTLGLGGFFKAPDEKMGNWNNNLRGEDLALAERNIDQIVSEGARPDRTAKEYERDLRSLSWKALFYVNHRGDPERAVDCLKRMESFLPYNPQAVLKEYDDFFYYGVQRNEDPRQINQSIFPSLTERYVSFLQKVACEYPDQHEQIQACVKPYILDVSNGDEFSIFNKEEYAVLLQLQENPAQFTKQVSSPQVRAAV